jgi:hypothetical protein
MRSDAGRPSVTSGPWNGLGERSRLINPPRDYSMDEAPLNLESPESGSLEGIVDRSDRLHEGAPRRPRQLLRSYLFLRPPPIPLRLNAQASADPTSPPLVID